MKTILAIEDDPRLRANIQDFLRSAGFHTLVAANGAEGMRLTENCQPDLVICHMATPEEDGHTVLKAMRSRGGNQYIPLIFTTEKTGRDYFRKGMELGADDCLTKPFPLQDLLNSIISCLDKQAIAHNFTQQQMESLRSSVKSIWPHELNTPINGIIGAAHLLRFHQHPEVQELADILLEHSGDFVRLTQNFLFHAELKLLASDKSCVRDMRERGKVNPTTACSIENTARKKACRKDRIDDLHLDVEDVIVPLPEEQVLTSSPA